MSEKNSIVWAAGGLTEGLHPWLHVPTEFVEPLGALAIAAGRVEMEAAVTYRSFFFLLDVSTRVELLRKKQFSSVLRDTAALMRTAIVSEVDASLNDEWKEWSQSAQAFMTQRNTWLHSTWGRGAEGWIPISLAQGTGRASVVTSSQIESAAMEGMRVASAGRGFAKRVKTVVTSDAYAARRNTRDPKWPDGRVEI